MQVKRLYYIRHGLSETNQQGRWGGHIDTPLVPEGHDQAKAAGQAARDQGLSFDIIVSSPLQRAHHTAQHIATHTGYPHENIVLHDIFKERAYGVMDGQPCDPEIVARHKTSEANIDHIEGVEKLADFQKRANQALAYLQSLPHETVLVVAHGAFGRALWRSITDTPTNIRGENHLNAKLTRLI